MVVLSPSCVATLPVLTCFIVVVIVLDTDLLYCFSLAVILNLVCGQL